MPVASRSGVTLTAGLLLGLARPAAARFSFLLSVPSVLAAGVYELYRERGHLLASSGDAANLLLASAVSGVVGYASIAFLLGYLKRHSTGVFILYRLALGGLLLGPQYKTAIVLVLFLGVLMFRPQGLLGRA